jgi:adenosylcobinamide-phosphate synthase
MEAPNALWLLFAALFLDALAGDPNWVWRRIPHPVVLAGKAVAFLDRRLNDPALAPARRRGHGVFAVALLVAGAVVAGFVLHDLFAALPYGWLLELGLVSILLAQNSLYVHVAAVARGFDAGGLAAARAAVRHIVGRDPERLDAPGVSRATIESLAENFSDGVVAPALWYGLLGLPGLLAYKAINTADSMIGHKSPPYREFGWAAARLDDLVNLPASRLSALLIALGGLVQGRWEAAWRAVFADARRHRSPNAGWPEAAMAGALGIALAGPRSYHGEIVEDAWMNPAGRRDAGPEDIGRALRLYMLACLAGWLLVVAAALVIGYPR